MIHGTLAGYPAIPSNDVTNCAGMYTPVPICIIIKKIMHMYIIIYNSI